MPLPSSDLLPSPGGAAPWVPEVHEVAALVAAYAREHVGGYQRPGDGDDQAGRERPTFTAYTDPTYGQVEAYISTAAGEITGRVGAEIPERCWTLARTTATWHAAASVEAKRRPAQTDDQNEMYRAFLSNFRASLEELVRQARWAPVRLA